MSIWANMKDAKPSGGGNYLPPGFKGTVRIQRCIPNEDGFKKDVAFIAEFEVLTTNIESVPVGCTRSWYQGKLDDPRIQKTALGEIASFVAAALGGLNANDESVRTQIAAQMPQIVGQDNPLEGRELVIETWTKKTKEGKDFTKHRFAVSK